MSNIQPPKARLVRAAAVLERTSGIAIHLGRNGIILVSPLFFGYVLLGAILTGTGLVTLPYPFLSVADDPVFNLLGFLAGIAIALASGGLLVLLMMNGLQRVGNQLATILIGISIGSSAALLRHTYETALTAILAGVRLLFEFAGVG
jgi:membrane protein DedA with SNARE-associated domain